MKTAFEEIVCSFQLTQFFMSSCISGRNWFWQFFYDWQTLIAGVLALFAALIGGALLWKQNKGQNELIEIQRIDSTIRNQKDKLEASQKIKAALIPVPHALTEIGLYLMDCFKAWEKEKADERPTPPVEALKVLMAAAPYVDDESFVSFQKLIIHSQVFESRVCSSGRTRPRNILDNMLIDLATYSYLNTRLFQLGRLEEDIDTVPYVKPTQADIEKILLYDFEMKLLVERDPILIRAERALRMRFPSKSGWTTEAEVEE